MTAEPPMVEVTGRSAAVAAPAAAAGDAARDRAGARAEGLVAEPRRRFAGAATCAARRTADAARHAAGRAAEGKGTVRSGVAGSWRASAPAIAEPSPKVDAKREPALDMPLPPIPARPRETRPATERRMPEMPAQAAVERGPAILKSGVIDGMPYTLYADGSIEAQLPQGTVKFASVDALRAHLEKQS